MVVSSLEIWTHIYHGHVLTGIRGPSTVMVALFEVVPNTVIQKRPRESESQLGFDGGFNGISDVVTRTSFCGTCDINGNGDVDNTRGFDVWLNGIPLCLGELSIGVVDSEIAVGAVFNLRLYIYVYLSERNRMEISK